MLRALHRYLENRRAKCTPDTQNEGFQSPMSAAQYIENDLNKGGKRGIVAMDRSDDEERSGRMGGREIWKGNTHNFKSA